MLSTVITLSLEPKFFLTHAALLICKGFRFPAHAAFVFHRSPKGSQEDDNVKPTSQAVEKNNKKLFYLFNNHLQYFYEDNKLHKASAKFPWDQSTTDKLLLDIPMRREVKYVEQRTAQFSCLC